MFPCRTCATERLKPTPPPLGAGSQPSCARNPDSRQGGDAKLLFLFVVRFMDEGQWCSRECHCGSLRTPKYLEFVLHRAEVRVAVQTGQFRRTATALWSS